MFAAAGREIEVEEIPVETLKRELVRAGVPPWNAEGLNELFELYAGGGAQMVTSGVKDALDREPRDLDAFATDHVDAFKEQAVDGGAWGAGLATFAGDRILEVFYPDPQLGARRRAGSRAERRGRRAHGLPSAQRADDRRDVRQAPVLTVIDDLAAPPRRTPPTPTCACTCSPTGSSSRASINLDGIFGALPNVAWTSARPGRPGRPHRTSSCKARADGRAAAGLQPRQVPAHDRLRDADRRARGRRRPRPPRRPPRRRHDGHARGLRELQRRHARALDGRGPHQRGRGRRRRLRRRRRLARSWARCPAAAARSSAIGERCLLGANAGHRHLARRRLHGRGRALRHRRARWSRCPTARSSRAASSAAPTACCSAATRRPARSRRCRAPAAGPGLNAALHAND